MDPENPDSEPSLGEEATPIESDNPDAVPVPVSVVVTTPCPCNSADNGYPSRPQRSIGAKLLPSLAAMIEQRQRSENRNEDLNSMAEVRRPTFTNKRIPDPDEDAHAAPVRELKRPKRTENTFMVGGNHSGQLRNDCMEVEPTAARPELPDDKGCSHKSYVVLYAKPTTKKHKTWDGDGVLTILDGGKEVILRDETNSIIESAYNYKLPDNFGEGTQIQIGGKVVEIQELQINGSNNSSDVQNRRTNVAEVPSASASHRQSVSVPAFQGRNTSSRPAQDVHTNASREFQGQQPHRFSSDSGSELQPTLENEGGVDDVNSGTTVYNVLYAKPTTKKHKTWDGDGVLTVVGSGREIILRDENDQIVASTSNFKLPESFGDGSQIQVGGKVVEIQEKVSSGTAQCNPSTTNGNNARGSSLGVSQFNREFRQPAAVHFQQPKSVAPDNSDARYSVLYAPPLTGKYPRWEGDGILTVLGNGKELTLTDDYGATLETASNVELPSILEEGVQMQIGGKFIEISRKLSN